jgi:rifampin ADP-ribosylating transferase
MSANASVFARQYFHGTRADLEPGDLVAAGHGSNHGTGAPLSWVYLTATLDAAIWGAELALGEGSERIYVVEPTGPLEDDPNVTDKRFPGNPTMSYRSREPLRVTAEVIQWQPHSAQQVQTMRDSLARLEAEGRNIIID